MKTLLIFLAIEAACLCLSNHSLAQGTAFTYQGQLKNAGNPANGNYDFSFAIFTNGTGGNSVAGPIAIPAAPVSNGLFAVTLDFGGAVFNGASNWLEISVRTNAGTGYTVLSPRQMLSAAPYAIFAAAAKIADSLIATASIQSSQISGSLPATQISGPVSIPQGGTGQVTQFEAGQAVGSHYVSSFDALAADIGSMYTGQWFLCDNGSAPWFIGWKDAASPTEWRSSAEFADICSFGDQFGKMPATLFGDTHNFTVNGNIFNQTNGIGTGVNSQDVVSFRNMSPGQVSGVNFKDNSGALRLELGWVNATSDTFHGVNMINGTPLVFADVNTWLAGFDGSYTVPGVYTNGGGTGDFVIYKKGATNYGTVTSNTVVTRLDHSGGITANTVTLSQPPTFQATNSPPSNPGQPQIWFSVTNNGHVYCVPGYSAN